MKAFFINETSGCLNLDVASTHVKALDADGVTLSHFVGNDSEDVQSS